MIIKRLLIFLTSLLAWMAMPAQNTDGSWNFFPASSPNVTDVWPTQDGAYFLLDTHLYWYSPADGESMAFSPVNQLSESEDIVMIRYFEEPGFLFVGYENGNIDLVYPSGKVINMADLRDAVINVSHRMTDVAYCDGRLFVGTDFGMVVFDTNRYEVIETGRFGAPVKGLAVNDGHILVTVGYGTYAAPVSGKHPSLDGFISLWGTNDSQLCSFGSCVAYTNNSEPSIMIRHLDFKSESPNVRTVKVPLEKVPTQLYRAVGDRLAAVVGNKLMLIDSEGRTETTALPSDLILGAAYPLDGLSNVWIAGFDKGVALYDLSGTPKVKADFFLPEGVTVPRINYMAWTADGEGLYVGCYSATFFNHAAGGNTDGFDMIQYTNLIEGSDVTDVSPRTIDTSLLSPALIQEDGTPHYYRQDGVAAGPNTFVADPITPGRYYLANNLYGVLVIDGDQITHVFHRGNMPTPTERWGERVLDVNLDSDGNLWVGIGYTDGPSTGDYVHAIAVLPADKLRGDLSKVKRSDWLDARIPNTYSITRDTKSVICRKSDMVVYVTGDVGSGWTFIDRNKTPLDFSDDTARHHTEYYDQNGASVSIYRPTAVAEDRTGRIWMGYDTGVMYTTPQDAVQPVLSVKRPIVPRNDGTEYGDYLLDGEFIYSIAADHSDRKWFATANNGVYLVNADGTAILKHFTKDNSPLPSNLVYYIAVDPHSNRVFFATEGGLVVYDSDSAPSADDFSDVYAYPNPVKPDYTGHVTIAGLMDNSSVKIADTAGNVIFSSRSEGGMVSWDACDSAGRRVRSGVYFVLAQSDASGSKEAVVTKIMVIN